MKKLVIFLLVCLPILCYAQAPAPVKPAATIPFRMFDHFMVISASLSSSDDSLHFIFDTGSEVTALSKETANKLNLTTKMDGGMSGINDVVLRVPTATINVLFFEKTRLPLVRVYIETLQELGTLPVHIDGIMGVDLLKAFIVKIDYEHQQLVLYRAGKTPADVKGSRQAMWLNFDTPALDAVITLPNGQSLASRYHLISGGDYGILFNYPFVEKFHLNTALPVLDTEKVQDLSKDLTYTNTSLSSLMLGPVKLVNVPSSYSKDVDDAGSVTEIAGAIGYYVWKQFRSVTINYNEKELYLEK